MNLTKTQQTIIRILFFENESSRSLLAKRLSLTNAALTLAVKPLLEEGMVEERREESNQKVGRKELRLFLHPSYGMFLGIDARRHNEYYCLSDFSGNILRESNNLQANLEEFCGPFKERIIAIGVSVRGNPSLDLLKQNRPELYEEVAKLNKPFYLFNNVLCLADIHEGYHPQDKNFLLVKYGPGLGSAIYVNGKPLGFSSELGHTLYQEKTVEDTISYSTLLGKEVEESEGTKLILSSEDLRKTVIRVLSFSLYNADSLLGLQKIVLSGELLTKEEIMSELKKQLKSLSPSFDEDKLCAYDDYVEQNAKKSCLGAFIKTFGTD